MAEAAKSQPLDDLMLAMDVVDTLRHEEALVQREIAEGDRAAALKERLRQIYASQGIEVSDRILDEGVKALAESRFVYSPPKAGFARRLALIYVTRERWGRWAAGAALVCVLALAGWYFGVHRPAVAEAERARLELAQILPERIETLSASIHEATPLADVLSRADALAAEARSAVAAADLAAARRAVDALATLNGELNQVYTVRIVQGPNELSGVWRVPDVNQNARNYYLIVEAVGPGGVPVKRAIVNEETGKTETVSRWGQRVSEEVFDRVRRDKTDDGIIQNAVIGEKRRGELEPVWTVPVLKGAITQW